MGRRKLIVVLVIIFFSVISILGITEAETRKKAPKKSRPKTEFPKSIQLPPPFDRWNSCDLALKIYSNYNCQTGTIVDGRVGTINKIATWKEGSKMHLLALFETYKFGAENLPSAESGKNVDIAVYGIDNDKLTLTASSNDISGYRWYGSSYFDLAPYTLNKDEIAFGVRVNPGIHGVFSEGLHLFRLRGNIIQPIFYRDMIDIEFYNGYENLSNKLQSESILQIVSKASGMNEFKVITRFYGFFEDDEVDRSKILKTTSEIWRWNEGSQVYELSDQQETLH